VENGANNQKSTKQEIKKMESKKITIEDLAIMINDGFKESEKKIFKDEIYGVNKRFDGVDGESRALTVNLMGSRVNLRILTKN